MRPNEYRFTAPDGTTITVVGSHWMIAMAKAKQRLKLARAAGFWVGDLATRVFQWDATVDGHRVANWPK